MDSFDKLWVSRNLSGSLFGRMTILSNLFSLELQFFLLRNCFQKFRSIFKPRGFFSFSVYFLPIFTKDRSYIYLRDKQEFFANAKKMLADILIDTI